MTQRGWRKVSSKSATVSLSEPHSEEAAALWDPPTMRGSTRLPGPRPANAHHCRPPETGFQGHLGNTEQQLDFAQSFSRNLELEGKFGEILFGETLIWGDLVWEEVWGDPSFRVSLSIRASEEPLQL